MPRVSMEEFSEDLLLTGLPIWMPKEPHRALLFVAVQALASYRLNYEQDYPIRYEMARLRKELKVGERRDSGRTV